MSKMGAPTKYKPEYCDLIIKMAKDGASFTEFRAEIGGISRQTLHNWKDAHPDFMDAYTRAEVLGEAHWDSRMRNQLMFDKEINTALVKLYFANRFGWSDKTESKTDITSNGESIKTFSDMYGKP